MKLLTLRVQLIPKLHCKPCYHKLIACSLKLEPRVELVGERQGNSYPSSVSLEPDNDTKAKSL